MNSTNIKNKIEEYLEKYIKLWAFSGSIAAIKNGEIVFSKAYGYANIEHSVKNTPQTKYKIWSITKQFTAAAVLMLEERGLLKVEDSLKKHFPEWGDLDPRVTIHHLMTNTSGIFNYSNLPDSHVTFQRMHHKKEDLIKLFTSKPLEFEPGTQYRYSNTGFYLLGMLIEKLSGMSYSEFLNENIFKPLGMYNTGVDNEKDIVENKASGYYLNGNSLIHCQYINMNLILSSGSIYSTAEDLLKWHAALSGEKLLTKSSIEKMNTPFLNNYGYGVEISNIGNRRVVHHNGGCEGFLAEIHRYLDDDFAVVVLSNYGFTAVYNLCKAVAAMALGDDYSAPEKPEAFPMSEETLKSYLGVYGGDGFKLELKKHKENIQLIIDDEYVLPVYPISENVFHHTWIDEEYAFTKDEEGALYLWGVKKV